MRHWYKTTAKNFDCNDHPTMPKQLWILFADYTGIPVAESKHFIDRLRHLSHCLEEPALLTLKRLEPGKNQLPKGRHEPRSADSGPDQFLAPGRHQS